LPCENPPSNNSNSLQKHRQNQPTSTIYLTRENPTTKVVIEVVCGGWVQVAMEEGKMEDGGRMMNVVAGYGGMGPMDDDWG
jgi:hypothetical protein